VVDWVNEKGDIKVACLVAQKSQEKDFLSGLNWLLCRHVYHELNEAVDKLSKEALELQDGTLCFQEFYDGQPMVGMTFYL
jgi:hypothetical protein